jgi:MORN repeat
LDKKEKSRRFEGEWLDGKQHGIGTYYSADGTRQVGEWRKGKRLKWIEEPGVLSPEHDNQENRH